ncbi:MAG: hypothetical protein GY756_20970 [bacterium]|nr:hypothetical protein [bacterium]
MKRAVCLLLVFIFGIIFDFGHSYAFLIRYILMIQLLFAFINLSRFKIYEHKQHFYTLLFMIVFSVTLFFLINFINHSLAVVAFIIAISPTAIAATVVANLLDRDVTYVASFVVLSNLFVAFLLPLILPLLDHSDFNMNSFLMILVSTLSVIFIPFILALILKLLLKNKVKEYAFKLKSIQFYLWLILMYLAISKASYFIRTNKNLYSEVIGIAILAAVICCINYIVGRKLGSKKFRLESSINLGHKNTALMIWFSLTFLNPLIALGPTCYVLFQNIYNAYLLSKHRTYK